MANHCGKQIGLISCTQSKQFIRFGFHGRRVCSGGGPRPDDPAASTRGGGGGGGGARFYAYIFAPMKSTEGINGSGAGFEERANTRVRYYVYTVLL